MIKRTIKGIRYDLGLNQDEMAKLLGISLSTYQRYENGTVNIPYKIAIMIADLGKIENLREIDFSHSEKSIKRKSRSKK